MAKRKAQKKNRPRHAFLKALLWTACFLAILFTLDQAALRLQPATPLLQELQAGYRVFRNRLLGRMEPAPLTIEKVIDRATPPPKEEAIDAPTPEPAPAQPASRPAKTAPVPTAPAAERYLYVDADGELQFADRLEDIPPERRQSAQPMDR